MRWKPRLPKLSKSDKVMALTLGPYFAWPFITQHGGPPPPKDMGTVVLGIATLYGTSKIVESKTKKAEDDSDDETD